jgi:hypothetical protein
MKLNKEKEKISQLYKHVKPSTRVMRRGQPNKKQIQCWRTRDPGYETNNNLLKENKNKKQPDLTRVKMSKPVILIVNPRYSHKKQVTTDYKTQFSTDLMFNW